MDDPIESHQLRSIVERIERLEEEKKTIADDIKEVYAEAKGNGYDVKVLRKAVALRRRDLDERREEEAILDLYMQALGELADTPLGRAAAPGFSSRSAMARSAVTHPERVSRPAPRQNPSEGGVGSAVRDGAPDSNASLGPLTAAQSEGAAGASPEEAAPASASEGRSALPAQGAEFVTPTGEGEGAAPPVDPSSAADEPIKGLAAANAIAAKAASLVSAQPRRRPDEGMPDIPAFLRRSRDSNQSMGEQA